MIGATAKQRAVLDFIKSRTVNGKSPTIREIRTGLGYKSDNTIRLHLFFLTKKGLVWRVPGKHRGLKITKGKA